jgi:hypothetical protein
MDLLDRLHARLRREVASRRPALADPLTVADLYQLLIPYRSVRTELGIMELAPYEHALLRLLAGERGYVRLLEPAVAAEIQRELEAASPILGIYRDYAGATLRLAGGEEAAPEVEGANGVEAEREPEPVGETPPPPPASPAPPPVPAPPRDPVCTRCAEPLPPVGGVRFCPACGADQTERTCPGCGASVRRAWNFCIRCGRRQEPAPEPSS